MKQKITTIMGVIGAIFAVVGFIKPDIFTAERIAVIMENLDYIIIGVLSIISAFSAKDQLRLENF